MPTAIEKSVHQELSQEERQYVRSPGEEQTHREQQDRLDEWRFKKLTPHPKMGHVLGWTPGQYGKGLRLDDGTLHTWNIRPSFPYDEQGQLMVDSPEFEGWPTHAQYTEEKGIPWAHVSDIFAMHKDDPIDQVEKNAAVLQDENDAKWDFQSRTAKKDELHVGLGIPKPIGIEIHNWAEEQDWPEGTELEPISEYHITMLYSPEGHSHKDDPWMDHEAHAVSIKGIKSFPSKEKGEGMDAIVLTVDSETIALHHKELASNAEEAGIEISPFSHDDFKPHMTIAYGSLPPGLKPPKLTFETEPSSVSPPREEEEESTEKHSWHIVRQHAPYEAELLRFADSWTPKDDTLEKWVVDSMDIKVANTSAPWGNDLDAPPTMGQKPSGVKAANRQSLSQSGRFTNERTDPTNAPVPLVSARNAPIELIANSTRDDDNESSLTTRTEPMNVPSVESPDSPSWTWIISKGVPIKSESNAEKKAQSSQPQIPIARSFGKDSRQDIVSSAETVTGSRGLSEKNKKRADSWQPRDSWPNALRERSTEPTDVDCTCKNGHKLDCPVHGMHPQLPTYEHNLEFPNPASPVGYDYHSEAPRTWMRAETRWNFAKDKKCLWLDDTRHPPDRGNWTWARNVKEAQRLLQTDNLYFDEMSLDHDLSMVQYEGKVVVNPDALSGGDFVLWLHEHGGKKHMPKSVTLHSHNGHAVELMYKALEPHCEVKIERASDDLEEDWAKDFKVHEPSVVKKEEVHLPEKVVSKIAFNGSDSREYDDTQMMPARTMDKPGEGKPHPESDKIGCTCDQDKLKCPIHGMNATEADKDHTWSLPESFPVSYPQSQPRNYQVNTGGVVADGYAKVEPSECDCLACKERKAHEHEWHIQSPGSSSQGWTGLPRAEGNLC